MNLILYLDEAVQKTAGAEVLVCVSVPFKGVAFQESEKYTFDVIKSFWWSIKHS
jgi:hypothetical protein